jgi:hypothetical protein
MTQENMYVQYSEGFPGVVPTAGSIYVYRRKEDITESMARLYTAYEEHDVDKYPNDEGQLDGIVSIQSLAAYIKDENFYRGTGEYKIPDDENLIYTYMSRLIIEKLKGSLYKKKFG